MTAIFTPGYAAPEQFTSAKQGPWTDIYGLSATLHHAITGQAPPSAFDRLMEDTYQSLAGAAPQGFDVRLLLGIDAGLSLPLERRPQSIAAWRTLLGDGPADGAPTLVMAPPPRSPPTVRTASPSIHGAPRLAGARRRHRSGGDSRRLRHLRSRAYTSGADSIAVGRSDAAAVRGSGGSRVDPLDRGPPAHTTRADGAGLRHARHGWRLRSALARDDRGLAAGAEASGDGLPDRGRKPGAARRQPAGAIGGRPAGCSDGRRRLLRGFAVGVGDGRRAAPLAPMEVDLRLAGRQLIGRIVHPTCGSLPVSLMVDSAGTVSGSLRLPEAAGCTNNTASASGRVGRRHADARSAWRRRQVSRHAVVAARAVAGKSGAAFGHAHRHALIDLTLA